MRALSQVTLERNRRIQASVPDRLDEILRSWEQDRSDAASTDATADCGERITEIESFLASRSALQPHLNLPDSDGCPPP
ncbi:MULTISPECIES: hypothetical protein [Bosea]|jgi:hypothetical protein|uniref:hypothetical protein n=1 Tax=Bosea TaxID=85413 RepID=UPI001113DFEB|nr:MULTISPECIES: hypothetical protein [Bosea]